MSGNPYRNVNGDANLSNGFNDITNASDIVRISGKVDNCESAKKDLLALVPITVDVEVPFVMHRLVIGQQGKEVRRIMDQFDVNITVPPAEEKSDFITVTGPPKNVEQTKAALSDLVERNFHLTVEVDPAFHGRLIGRKRMVISKVENDHRVTVMFPTRADPNSNVVTIIGREQDTHTARADLLKLVQEMENQVSLDVTISPRFHSIIIGAKGRRITKLMDKYRVTVHFPRMDEDQQDKVTITGLEDNVLDCRDELLVIVDEQDELLEEQDYLQSKQQPTRYVDHDDALPSNGHPSNKGYIVTNAPWDTQSNEDFPSIGGGIGFSSPTSQAPNSTWGPPRKN